MKRLFIVTTLLTTLTVANNEILTKACKENNATACYELALPKVTGENAKIQDVMDEGTLDMRKACVYGESRACDKLGDIYFKNKSYGMAIRYLEGACQHKVSEACQALGTIYRDAHDVEFDDVKSREYYEKACALGSGDSCYNVALIYRGGFGVKKTRSKEKEFYKKACDQNLTAGCERFTELDNEDRGIETGFFAKIKAFFK